MQLPLMTNPAIVDLSKNDKIDIRMKEGYKVLEAYLVAQDGAETPVSSIAPESFETNTYSAVIGSPGVAPGLYGLRIRARKEFNEEADFQARSVWVMSGPPEKLVFAHISDSHTGDPRSTMSKSVETPDERRAAVFRAACDSGAAFMVITGDLVSVPGNYQREYPKAYDEIRDNVSIPLFVSPGNHDLYTMSNTSPKPDGVTFWSKYFGPLYYDFSIGRFTFIALNSYDWPVKFRNFMNSQKMEKYGSYSAGMVDRDQVRWLDGVLSAGELRGDTMVCFAHHRVRNFAKSKPGEFAKSQVVETLLRHGVRYYLAGHIHSNSDTASDGINYSTVVSSSSKINEDAAWGYKLCTLEPGRLSCEFVPVIKQL